MSGLDNSTLRDFLKFVKFDRVNLTGNRDDSDIIDWREDIAGKNSDHKLND
jgi:hypothetical protein